MINLPFKMIFDLDFSNKIPEDKILNKLIDFLSKINPKPNTNIILNKINIQLLDFIITLSKINNIEIFIKNPKITFLNELSKICTLNIEITKKDYNLECLTNYYYNLIISAGFKQNLYKYICSINNQNINKIIIKQNTKMLDINHFFNQVKQIRLNKEISKKCFLNPYLEERELKNICTNLNIRPFLTCASLWINPIINHEGKIKMPCFNSINTLLDKDFFVIWDEENINLVRRNLLIEKQFNYCKYCDKFYQNNFLIVENAILKYRNKEYKFKNTLNPTLSAPIVGIINDNNFLVPIPLYSDKDINEAYKKFDLIFVLKK